MIWVVKNEWLRKWYIKQGLDPDDIFGDSMVKNMMKCIKEIKPTELPTDIVADAYNISDYLLIIFASQLFVVALIGLLLSNKHLFLFLINLEILYLAGSFMFIIFSVYWFYEPKGFIYAFLVIVLAGAESVLGFALLITLHRRGVKLKFFKDKKNKLGYFLAIVPKDNQYANVLFYFLFFCLLLILIYYILYKLVPKTPNNQKGSSFECGFEPNGDARMSQHIHFYTIALLFLLFDLELMFLIPWVLSLSSIGSAGRLAMLVFFILLCVGFAFEFEKQALDFMLFEEAWAKNKYKKKKELRSKLEKARGAISLTDEYTIILGNTSDKIKVKDTNLTWKPEILSDEDENEEFENALKIIKRIQNETEINAKASNLTNIKK